MALRKLLQKNIFAALRHSVFAWKFAQFGELVVGSPLCPHIMSGIWVGCNRPFMTEPDVANI